MRIPRRRYEDTKEKVWGYQGEGIRIPRGRYEDTKEKIWGYKREGMRILRRRYEDTKEKVWGYQGEGMRILRRRYEDTKEKVWGYQAEGMRIPIFRNIISGTILLIIENLTNFRRKKCANLPWFYSMFLSRLLGMSRGNGKRNTSSRQPWSLELRTPRLDTRRRRRITNISLTMK